MLRHCDPKRTKHSSEDCRYLCSTQRRIVTQEEIGETLVRVREDHAAGKPRSSISARGHTPLVIASYNGQIEAVRFLLEEGADIDQRDHAGNTALMGAAFKGDLEIVQVLIENGADPRLANPQGLTAKSFAEMFGRVDVAKFLAGVSIET
jgi:hypothetical protein